jgi:ribosomal 30S subunit maturation factor RimM
MISLAFDLAERQLADGTASSQVITHYLKLATSREKLEQEKLELEKTLLQARTDSIESAKKVEELYGNALNAMRAYQGKDEEEVFYD